MTSLTDYLDTIRVVYPSLVTAAALGISGGIVGAFVLLRREALLTLAMPQVVAVGAAIGLRMGWPSLPPALGAVIIAVLLLAWSRRQREGNWLLPALYIGGLSLSFLIIAHSGEHVIEMQNLFTGMDVGKADSENSYHCCRSGNQELPADRIYATESLARHALIQQNAGGIGIGQPAPFHKGHSKSLQIAGRCRV